MASWAAWRTGVAIPACWWTGWKQAQYPAFLFISCLGQMISRHPFQLICDMTTTLCRLLRPTTLVPWTHWNTGSNVLHRVFNSSFLRELMELTVLRWASSPNPVVYTTYSTAVLDIMRLKPKHSHYLLTSQEPYLIFSPSLYIFCLRAHLASQSLRTLLTASCRAEPCKPAASHNFTYHLQQSQQSPQTKKKLLLLFSFTLSTARVFESKDMQLCFSNKKSRYQKYCFWK